MKFCKIISWDVPWNSTSNELARGSDATIVPYGLRVPYRKSLLIFLILGLFKSKTDVTMVNGTCENVGHSFGLLSI